MSNCKCGNPKQDGKTWCDVCFDKLTKKWDKEIYDYKKSVGLI